MQVLYVNNYRSFKDTYIPLKNINFFIGENSTGKSSILSLIHILGNPMFFLTLDFNNENVNLGYFSEIASQGKKSFTVGMFNQVVDTIDSKKIENQMYDAVLLTFKNKDEVPTLSSLHILDQRIDMKITIFDNCIKYKYSVINKDSLDLGFFKKWCKDYYLKGKRTFTIENVDSKQVSSLFQLIWKVNENIMNSEDRNSIIIVQSKNLFMKSDWIDPIRAKPKSTYDAYNINASSDNDHMPYILRKLFNSKTQNKEYSTKGIDMLNNFGKESGMFDSISVKNFSREKSSPFEINITFNNNTYKITNVGYGVSQILPIIVDILTKNTDAFIIQQPEVHLHPKAQAAVGEFIFKMSHVKKQIFILETHSDFIIDRFRICQRKAEEKNKLEAQVLFFERKPEGNIVSYIEIDENGDYSDNQPEQFRDFFINEEMDLLGL